jgi:hypothetical protein
MQSTSQRTNDSIQVSVIADLLANATVFKPGEEPDWDILKKCIYEDALLYYVIQDKIFVTGQPAEMKTAISLL